ncbi:MAG: sulfite exporter TauE/SafE family protein [Myxococcaceae bacterium]
MAALLIAAGALVGALGAMLGVGGGVLLVPLLVFGFGYPIEEAVPVSLLCVVASSCGAAANYVEAKLADVRLALTLETATVFGAVVGGFAAGLMRPQVVALCFGAFALVVSSQLARSREEPTGGGDGELRPVRYGLGVSGSFVAGTLSAVLGVGGGPIKVPLMSFGMRVPFKVAAATSNLMIGVTAAASVTAYAARGQLRLALAAPLVVGVLAGAGLGTRLMVRAPNRLLRRLLAGVLLIISLEMLWKGGVGLWPS